MIILREEDMLRCIRLLMIGVLESRFKLLTVAAAFVATPLARAGYYWIIVVWVAVN